MLNARIGSSVNSEVQLAGREAASCVKDLKDLKMAFVYSGVQFDQKELLKTIGDELPGVPLIGNTSFTGVITNEGYIAGENGFVGLMGVSGDDLVVGIAGLAKEGTARATGRRVAELAMANAGKAEAPSYFYMVASPGEEELYLKGITDVIGRVPLFGGSAADNSITGEWELFTGDMVTTDGVAVAFFYTDHAFANEYTGAYDESNHVGIATKVKDLRTLVEIDGVPALEKYQEWTNTSHEEIIGGNLLVYSITAPLGVKDPLGDLVAIRHPMNGNEDGTISVGNNLAENTAIILMEGSIDGLLESVQEAIDKVNEKLGTSPSFYHLVHCGGRRAGIGERIDELAERLQKAAGDVPFICEFTFGEYGYEDDGKNTCGGLMLSFTAFGE
ncbi:MAG: FIST N-terminal domain-containing protein [Tissierellia bacterium]|nr:FIST N-terminal domain-containing protein [Tissierellia bacterium]